jgi:hypothetical protein
VAVLCVAAQQLVGAEHRVLKEQSHFKHQRSSRSATGLLLNVSYKLVCTKLFGTFRDTGVQEHFMFVWFACKLVPRV